MKYTPEELVAFIQAGQRPPKRDKQTSGIGTLIEHILVSQFHATCTKCFAGTVHELNSRPVTEIREQANVYGVTIWENAQVARDKHKQQWATNLLLQYPKATDPFYRELIIEACGHMYLATKYLHSATWSVGMTVAHRERPTVKATVESLAVAGWPHVHLFAEPNANDLPNDVLITWNKEILGNWGNFCQRLKMMLQTKTTHLLLVQDDVEFLPNTRQWLEEHWPCNEGMVSLYRSSVYDKHTSGMLDSDVYNILGKGRPFLGALAIAMSRPVAESLLLNFSAMTDTNTGQDDIKLGKYVDAVGVPMNIVRASRCQHTGLTSSIYPHTKHISKSRKSASYVRE